MFRTTKCSSLGSLYKQHYGIFSCICIRSLVFNRMCLAPSIKQSSGRICLFIYGYVSIVQNLVASKIRCSMNNQLEGIRSWSNLTYCLRTQEKHENVSVRATHLWTQIVNQNLPGTRQE
jgi:hypothetical protein